MRTTYMAKPGEVERRWYVIDATDIPLGRLSAVVAPVLYGKNKPASTPHLDTGDFIIVINTDRVRLIGKEVTDKIYHRHNSYPRGLKSITAGELRVKNSRRLIETSVKGMPPKNTLGRKQFTKLNTYGGAEHPHAAQQPEALDIVNLIQQEGIPLAQVRYTDTSRRKNVVARVRLVPGTGEIIIDKKGVEEYIPYADLREVINQPFAATETEGAYDIFVNVNGGGYAGQSGAIRRGITRALLEVDPDFRLTLKHAGLLMRDVHMVERKKPDPRKARKVSQFSKC